MKSAMPSQTVRSCVERFKSGRMIHDDDRSRRPSDAVNEETTASVLMFLIYFKENWPNFNF